jgi:hypothetical protein
VYAVSFSFDAFIATHQQNFKLNLAELIQSKYQCFQGVTLQLIDRTLASMTGQAASSLDDFLRNFSLPAWESRFRPLAQLQKWRMQERYRHAVYHSAFRN